MPPLYQRLPSPRDRFKHDFVAFFHPAYPDHAPPLLTLAAVDATREGDRGIDYDTAKAACGIVACNRYDDGTYFAQKHQNEGEQEGYTFSRISRPYDDVLPSEYNYYFIVDTPEHRYPVVANFDHWRFPHGALPLLWEELARRAFHNHVIEASDGYVASGSPHNRTGDVSCFETTQLAGVAPFSNKMWLESNQIEKYYRLQGAGNAVHRDASLFRLEAEIHCLFGDSWLPSTRLNHISRRLEIHPLDILQRILYESQRMSQNGLDQNGELPAPSISCEQLFIRFAFNILSGKNYKFLRNDLEYNVCLFDIENREQYTVELHSDAIKQYSRIFPTAPRAQNVGPDNNENVPAGRAAETCRDSDSDSDSDDSSDDSHEIESRPRGRVRRRSPTYYRPRALHDGDQQSLDHPQRESPVPVIPRPQHLASISSLSLPSVVSMSSFEAPHAGSTLGMGVDRDKKPDPAAGRANPKRRYDDDKNQSDGPQPPKRSRHT